MSEQFGTTISNGTFHERMSFRFDDDVPPCDLGLDCAHGPADGSCCSNRMSPNKDFVNTAIRCGPWMALSFNSTPSASFKWVVSTLCNSYYFPALFTPLFQSQLLEILVAFGIKNLLQWSQPGGNSASICVVAPAARPQ